MGANSAFDKHEQSGKGEITADILKYHVIEGKKSLDALNVDQPTLQGTSLTAYRKFRKNWLTTPLLALSPRDLPRVPTGLLTSSAITVSSMLSTRSLSLVNTLEADKYLFHAGIRFNNMIKLVK